MDGRHYKYEDIKIISQSLLGKTLEELMNSKYLTIDESNKGSFGQFIEYYFFNIKNNSDSKPDFIDEQIELKVTPYKRLNDGEFSAKERLVLNIIDYNTEYKNEFKTSHFWLKNKKIEIIWYLWTPNENKKNYKITHEKLLNLEISNDLKQIEEDWNVIINKIKLGKAHEISEADTMYLGACPKGLSKSSLRTQPFNIIKAKQRAFCFKKSYMTQLVRKYIGNYENVENIIKNSDKKIIDYVNEVICKYKNKSQSELIETFNLNTSAKNKNAILINKMFGVKGSLANTDEFLKAKIIPKTIRIEESGKIKESISFPYFKYEDIYNQEWEYSDLKNELETTKYMFFIFKKRNKEYYFENIVLWNMNENDIETYVKDAWNKTKITIGNGNIIKSIINGKRKTNFIGMSDNKVCHVRPHGKNSKDVCKLPIPDKLTGIREYTKQCFWINNKYIEKELSKYSVKQNKENL